mgnify:CR=1 FL=1
MTREQALARLRAQIEAGKPIIGAGAGTGLSAKCAEAGGTDRAPRVAADRDDAAGRSTADDPSVLAGGIHSGAMVVAGLVGAGFDPGWVLDAFTRQPARAIGRTDLGTLEVGARADLVRWTPSWTVGSTWIDGDRFVADPD